MHRNNYKTKWLAALADSETTPTQQQEAIAKSVQTLTNVNTDAALNLGRIQHECMQAASEAKKTISVINDFQQVAGIDFGESAHPIDEKIGSMPLPVMLRRIRDVLKLSTNMIGILAISAEESHRSLKMANETISGLTQSSKHLQAAIVSSTLIGHSPTSNELEDYQDTKEGDYYRHGIQYEDLNDDWFESRLTRNTVLREKRKDDSDSESDDDYTTSSALSKSALVKATNRSAAIMPRTPNREHPRSIPKNDFTL